ncbi:MAG: class I SAM-dependent methyltransferase, partial [Candidatus Riflebacteria bacterium]|nr:class I SAM-dependent methyltransferase [Candidatus Riflebacteria bacterium]
MIGLLPSDVSAIGVDVAAGQINFAMARYGSANRRFQAIIDNVPLPFRERTFDAVTVVEFIEHLQHVDSLRLLREVNRVLRPGGRLIVTTPNYHSFWPVLESVINLVGKVTYEKQHVCHYYPRRLCALMTSAGFAIPRVETFLVAAPFMAPFGWELADRVACWEERHCGGISGNLLLGIGDKAL